MILAILIYYSPRYFLSNFKTIGLLFQEKKRNNRFSKWRSSAVFDLSSEQFCLFLSTSHPNASYQVSSELAFRFSRREKNRFSRWRPLRLRIRTIWTILLFKTSDASYQVSSQLVFRFRRRSKLDFPDSSHGGHFGFQIGTILALFNLQVTLMFLSRFKSICFFGSGEKAKNRFSRWRLWWPSWIFDRTYLFILYLQVTPMLPTNFNLIGLLVKEKVLKIYFKDGAHGGQLVFLIRKILAIFDV